MTLPGLTPAIYMLTADRRERKVKLYACDKCGNVIKRIGNMKRIELTVSDCSGGEGSVRKIVDVEWCVDCVKEHLWKVEREFKVKED